MAQPNSGARLKHQGFDAPLQNRSLKSSNRCQNDADFSSAGNASGARQCVLEDRAILHDDQKVLGGVRKKIDLGDRITID